MLHVFKRAHELRPKGGNEPHRIPCPFYPHIQCSLCNPRILRGATLGWVGGVVGVDVSIHAPARVRRHARGGASSPLPGFNSRTREGCDGDDAVSGDDVAIVSIHAPARGAIGRLALLLHKVVVSIHAPARGATVIHRHLTTHRRVSIHASARGATRHGRAGHGRTHCFNSRTREGCDIDRPATRGDGGGFNSRTREGCDSRT